MSLYTQVQNHAVGLLAFGPNLFSGFWLQRWKQARVYVQICGHTYVYQVRLGDVSPRQQKVNVSGFMRCTVVTCMLV